MTLCQPLVPTSFFCILKLTRSSCQTIIQTKQFYVKNTFKLFEARENTASVSSHSVSFTVHVGAHTLLVFDQIHIQIPQKLNILTTSL